MPAKDHELEAGFVRVIQHCVAAGGKPSWRGKQLIDMATNTTLAERR